MEVPLSEIGQMVFKRSNGIVMSDYAKDIKTFNILWALDGKRSVSTIAREDAYDQDILAEEVNELLKQGLIEPACAGGATTGRAKKILDAIIHKRSRGVTAIAKSLKIKFALKGINPDALSPLTPDDPILLSKLEKLAKSYGVQLEEKSDRSYGKTRLILDLIITQRSGGDPAIAKAIKNKFILKGLNPDAYSLDTPDDPLLIKQLIHLAKKLGVTITMPGLSPGIADLSF